MGTGRPCLYSKARGSADPRLAVQPQEAVSTGVQGVKHEVKTVWKESEKHTGRSRAPRL